MPRYFRHIRPAQSIRSSRGAVIFEAAIFFLFTISLFFVTVNFALWLRENYVLKEAARHGGRSLAASTVKSGICPGDLDPSGGSFCSDLWVTPPVTTDSILTAVWSSCDYVEKAGYDLRDFTASAKIGSGDLDRNSDKGTPNKFYDVEVIVQRTSGRACLFCSLFNLGRTAQLVRFPLNPYHVIDQLKGLERCTM